MKTKFSRILGVGLTVVLLASLMLVAAPVAANPGELTFSAVSTPSKINEVLQAGTDIDFLVATPDGGTLYAFDNGNKLYKSTNAGVKWSAAETTATAVLTGKTLVDLAISPNFATDKAIVAATTTEVYYSADGGAVFNSVAPSDLITKRDGGTLTSIDIGTWWQTGVLTVLAGVTGGSANFTSVLKFELNKWAWDNVGTPATMTEDVVEVAFSPAHQGDSEVLCVSANATGTYLRSHFGLATLAWDLTIPATKIIAQTATDAIIAFGSEYIGSTTNSLLVGIQGTTADDVFRVTSRGVSTAGIVYDVTVTVDADNAVTSISVSGDLATGTVVAGVSGKSDVYYVTNVTTKTATTAWTASTKDPTGTVTSVLWAGGVVVAGTTGNDSAFSKSTDATPKYFNQVGMIDVGTIANMALVDSAIVDAKTMFVIMSNATGGYLARHLYKTTDGGATWLRIDTGSALAIVAASPAYATDSTLFVTDATATIKKSTDGGTSFTSEWVPANVTAILVVDKDTYFTGASAAVYKKGRYTAATGLAGSVMSIALSPKYATDKTLLVGNDAGSVYISTDDGVKFTAVGATGSLGTGATVYVAPDPKFDTNKTIYAGSSDNTIGVQRTLETSTTAAWKQLDDDTNTLVCGGLSVTTTLYAASNFANKGIRRSLAPLTTIKGTTATATELADLAFESMTGGTTVDTQLPSGAKLTDLSLISNVLYAIAKGQADPVFGTTTTETFGYGDRLVTISDILTVGPTLSSPVWKTSATTGETIPLLTTTTKATLEWKAVTGATKYDVWYSDGSTFSTTDVDVTTVKTTSTTASLKITGLTAGATYYWKVRVASGFPLLSPWSAVWKFNTALATTGGTSPALTTPAQGAINVSITPSFAWPVVTGAVGYDFVIGDDPTFAIILYAATASSNAHASQETLKYDTTYYWRVRAYGQTLGTEASVKTEVGAWSVGIFTTESEPVVVEPTVIVEKETEIKVIEVPVKEVVQQAIPDYLLWIIIAVGAVLVICLIVLIVRTRRVA